MQLYLSYREDDASGFALSVQRWLAREVPDARIVSGAIPAGAQPAPVPGGSTILLLVGSNWLRSGADAPIHLANAADPQRKVLERALAEGVKIVPLLFQVPSRDWEPLCRQLPATLTVLAKLNAVEIRPQSFPQDLAGLLASLRAPERSTPWTEAGARTIIRVETESGGLLKWWTGRDKTLRVVVDGTEAGALTAWNSHFEAGVEPGRHKVQLREGPFFKSAIVEVDVSRGSTVTLVCARNGFTGTVSLARKP